MNAVTRKCKNYNPGERMVKLTYNRSDGTSEEQMYLQVKDRLEWFNAYCEENGLKGYVDDSDVQIVPLGNAFFAVSTATVFINGEVVGKSSGGRPITGNYADDVAVIQSAATTAKGRALANAGFTIAGGTVVSEDDDEFPVDSGVRVVTVANGRAQSAPAETAAAAKAPAGTAASAKPDKAPAAAGTQTGTTETAPRPVPTPVRDGPMTLEEARKVVIPSGKYGGQTMGELLGSDPSAVKFYAFKYNGKNETLRIAAKTLLKAI